MSLKALLTGELTLGLRIRSALLQRSYVTVTDNAKDETVDLTSVDTQPQFIEYVDKPDDIETIRNKSKLHPQHYNVQHNRRPYEGDGYQPFHKSKVFKMKMLGRYGIEGSAVDPGFAWPSKYEIEEKKEYERVAYPYSLKEVWAQIEEAKHAKAERIRIREITLAKNMAKTSQWEKELNAKIAKKEAAVKASQERKERLVEEVRRHFGFKVDPRDEKFKQMIEEKEKEDKKRRKAAKKQQKAERLMAYLMAGGSTDSSKEGSPDAETKNKSKPETPADVA